MAEYGVVLAVIALIVVVALTALSGAITGTLDRVSALLG
jgi:Flp pilus assembly pilin Flp